MEHEEPLKAALADRYQIEREVGSGGMATVYLAQDLKHDRQVALKVLKPELAALMGGERFLTEIKTTAHLQHPHILPLFDSGEVDGFLFYVMPFVEGESLRDRLSRERQLPVDEAVSVATAVAGALDYAHRHGVIHRDIKPANILLHDGQPMVADFGIALAVRAAGGERLTETGLSLGTPQYMSPEQAAGDREVDGRSDLYSLGCVLYEMLTGEPPHSGPTVQAVIAKLLTDKPRPVTELRDTVPVHVGAVVHKALEKLPADRFETAKAFANALADRSFRHGGREAQGRATVARPRTRDPVFLAITALGAVGIAFSAWALSRPKAAPPVARYDIVLPQEAPLAGFFQRLTLTPHGFPLVYVAGHDFQTQLWVRGRNELVPTPVAGTDGALGPFVSPDGGSIGFVTADGSLRVVALSGGTPVTLADTLAAIGCSWSSDGYIYTTTRATTGGLARVSATGQGGPEVFTHPDSTRGDIKHVLPVALPHAKGVLFVVERGPLTSWEIAVANAKTGVYHDLVPGVYARYAADGHLLYVTADGTLMAQTFDEESLKLEGDPVALTSGIPLRPNAVPDLDVSADGTLVYTTGAAGAVAPVGEPVWVTRDGVAAPVAPDWTHQATYVALSPDGEKLAVSIVDGMHQDIWVRQLSDGNTSKLTFMAEPEHRPEWGPQGRSILFVMEGGDAPQLFLRSADGTGSATPIQGSGRGTYGGVYEGLLTRDGAWLVYREGGGYGADLYARRLTGDTSAVALATTEAQESSPAVSPDSRWLAYVSDEEGQPEIYVRPFPDVANGKWVVSTSGGSDPMWSRDGRELFYRNGSGQMVAVEVVPNQTPPTGHQQILFDARPYATTLLHQQYDVAPDGKRFLMIRREENPGMGDLRIVMVENFFTELKAKVPR